MNEQSAQIARVESRVAEHIRAFLASVGGVGTFRARDLQAFVAEKIPGSAPASADRILRKLKREGVIDYVVLNRGESLYRFDGFSEPEPEAVTMKQGWLF